MSVFWTERAKLAVFGWLATMLTALSFFPALEDKSYFPKAAALSAALVGLGMALRAVRTPALVVFGVQLVVMIELLLLSYGEDFKYAVVPTRATFSGIESVVSNGFDVAEKFPAPAPHDPGLLLMVIFAIGLAAVVVDMLALGLSRAPLAGLPLLALYTIPVAALPDGVPFVFFVPGAAAYIAMLTLDERDRLAHWGRLVSRNSRTQEPSQLDTSGLHATGRQVSVMALTIAVVMPIFIPALSSSILDSGRGGTGGDGSGRVLSFDDPMVSLAKELKRKDPVDLMRITASIAPEYVRLVALDEPGPNAWTATPTDLGDTIGVSEGLLPPPFGQTDAVETRDDLRMEITLTDDFPSDSSWLPVPFGVSQINTTAAFAYVPEDQTVTAGEDGAINNVTTYPMAFDKPLPTAEQLRGAGEPSLNIMRTYGTVPPDVPEVVAQTAADVTAAAESHYDEAVLLQSYFRRDGQFGYDLSVGYGSGYGSMAEFLQAKVGFCQQYAATMAMMARTLGIPSRVVVGFLMPSGRDGERYVFDSHSVHAWPELYFEGVGWVQFEPTTGLGAPFPLYARGIDSATGSVNTDTGPTLNREPTSASGQPAADKNSGSGSGSGSGVLPSGGWLVLVLMVVLLFLPAGLRYAVRRARLTRPFDDAAAAEAAWIELRDHVRDLRLPWGGSMTPRARERDVLLHLGGDRAAQDALHRLAMAVERARYSATPRADAAPAADARIVMATMSRVADRAERLKAFFWPTSLMPDIRRGWSALVERVRREPRLS